MSNRLISFGTDLVAGLATGFVLTGSDLTGIGLSTITTGTTTTMPLRAGTG